MNHRLEMQSSVTKWIFHSTNCGRGKSHTCGNIREYLGHVSWAYLTCPPCYYLLIIPAQYPTLLPSLPKHCSLTRGYLSTYQHEILWNKNRILRTKEQTVPVSLIKFIFKFPDLMHPASHLMAEKIIPQNMKCNPNKSSCSLIKYLDKLRGNEDIDWESFSGYCINSKTKIINNVWREGSPFKISKAQLLKTFSSL